jgi:uncharacterized protein with ParB-like and HNH nuclease domain
MDNTIQELMQSQFNIPYYQRDYSWKKENVMALLNDFRDAVIRKDNNKNNYAPHYLASIITMDRRDRRNAKNIIDGQQRITTIIMILSAIRVSISDTDEYDYVIKAIEGLLWPAAKKYNFIISSPGDINTNTTYLDQLLKNVEEIGNGVNPVNKVQRNILNQYALLCNELKPKDDSSKDELQQHDESLINLFDCIYESSVTTHSVSDLIESNRIFLTLNARGKPLSNFDKIKALLIYYAEKINSLTIAEKIHQNFCEIKDEYEKIDDIIDDDSIRLRKEKFVNEDVLLGWHYCIFERIRKQISAKEVYDALESKLSDRSLSDEDKKEILNKYYTSAVDFFKSIREVLEKSQTTGEYYKAVVMGRLTAIVWPLIATCQKRDLLDKKINPYDMGDESISLIRFIQIFDKIHQLTQSQGQDIISLAYDVYNEGQEIEEILDVLLRYHEEKWSESGHSLKSKVSEKADDDRRSDYFDYLMFEYVFPDCYDIDELKSHRNAKYVTVPFLREYAGMKVRDDHGIAKKNELNGAIRQTGNHFLLSQKCRSVMDTFVKQNHQLSPMDFKEIIAGCGGELPPETQNFIDGIHEISDLKRNLLDKRTASIIKELSRSWEIYSDFGQNG